MSIFYDLTPGPDFFPSANFPPFPIPAGEGVVVTGREDNDTIEGTNFDDDLYGGQQDDFITAGAGNDLLFGNLGDDTLRGSSGDNELFGGQGNDLVIGGTGKDILYGNEGNDTIRVISATTLVFGGQGDDTIYVQFSDNTVYANKENDIIIVQGNNSFSHGGDGNDKITLEVAGPATLIGGKASDTFEFVDGVASADLVIKGGGGTEGNEPPAEGEIDKILVMGTNDFSGADISAIAEIDVAVGGTGTFDATIFNGTLNGPASRTTFSGGGIIVLKGSSAEVSAALQHIDVVAGTKVQNEDGTAVVPLTTGLSRALYDLPTSLTEFFVIDGSQFAALIPPTSAGALNKSLGALAFQFGVITTAEAQAINADPTNITPEVSAKIAAFGGELNNAQYIPQVTQGQYDELIDPFYVQLQPPGVEITPVNNRFLSVIDTQDTPAPEDDVTTLYYSPTGDFSTDSTDNSVITSYNIPGFTASNPPLQLGLSLSTIDPSTQLVPIV